MGDYHWYDQLALDAAIAAAAGSGGAAITFAYFSASDTSGFTGAAYIVNLDVKEADGEPGVVNDATPHFGIDVELPGVYLAHANLFISSCDPGDTFICQLTGGAGDVRECTANAAGVAQCALTAAPYGTLPSVDAGFTPLEPVFQLSVQQTGGTGTTPDLATAHLQVTKIGY